MSHFDISITVLGKSEWNSQKFQLDTHMCWSGNTQAEPKGILDKLWDQFFLFHHNPCENKDLCLQGIVCSSKVNTDGICPMEHHTIENKMFFHFLRFLFLPKLNFTTSQFLSYMCLLFWDLRFNLAEPVLEQH